MPAPVRHGPLVLWDLPIGRVSAGPQPQRGCCSNDSAASIRVSDRVGWVWIVAARSSTVIAVSTASAPSAMSSPAPGPTIPTPSTRPVSGSARIFVRPSLRPSVRARPEAAHSRLAILTVRPSRAASDSDSPHQATSGSVNTTAGTTTLSNAAGRTDHFRRDLALAHRAMGEHGLAGNVADRVDRRVGGTTAIVDGDEAARVGARARVLETQPRAGRAPADRDQHAIEGLRVAGVEARLDRRALLEERRHLRAQVDLREERLAPAGERLDEGSVHARQEPVGHLDEGHLAPERRVDLTELETDVAAADHEEPLGHLAELERRRRVDDAIADERQSGQPRRRRARRDDRVLEAHLLRLVALHAQLARALEDGAAADDVDALGLRDRREPPREPADDALALPLAQRVERDARLAEIDAELAGALGVLDQRGDVEQGFRRDAALEETGPPEPLARVDHDGLEPQLRAAERCRVAARPAAHDSHVHLDDEVAHHHGPDPSLTRPGREPPTRGRSDGCC